MLDQTEGFTKATWSPCKMARPMPSQSCTRPLDSSFAIFCLIFGPQRSHLWSTHGSDGKERGGGEARREEGSERVSPQASWVDWTASPRSENSARWKSLERWGQGQAPVRERSGWWCQKESICLLRTLSANWHRQPRSGCQFSLQ